METKMAPRHPSLLSTLRSHWAVKSSLVAACFSAVFGPLTPTRAYWSDSDSDGVSDTWTNPETGASIHLVDLNLLATDADSDGASNDQELMVGTDPYSLDTDLDGLTDGDEINFVAVNFPGTSPTSWDGDGDFISDYDEFYGFSGVVYEGGQLPNFQGATYSDYDGDGVSNPSDPAPMDPSNTINGYSWYGYFAEDYDGDSIINLYDPLPWDLSNYGENNGQSWYSEAVSDFDDDGIQNWQDPFPYDSSNYASISGVAFYDTVLNDDDADGVPNWCDPCPADASNYSLVNYIAWFQDVWNDSDLDGVANWEDGTPHPAVVYDADGDGYLDESDPYPYDSLNFSSVNGANWYGNVFGDDDSDGFQNYQDPFPSDYSNYSSWNGMNWHVSLFYDYDSDGVPNYLDSYPNGEDRPQDPPPPDADSDYDGIVDHLDPAPLDPSNYSTLNQTSWYGGPNGDEDGDGFANFTDPFPYDAQNFSPYNSISWTGGVFLNDDGDFFPNWQDPAPNDNTNTSAVNGQCWYWDAYGNQDQDAYNNWEDPVPFDADNYSSYNGRNWFDTLHGDDDSDGLRNWHDPFPSDASNHSNVNNLYWYEYLFADADSDGILNYTDPYPSDATNFSEYNGQVWYGEALGDADGDGFANYLDMCPNDPNYWDDDPLRDADGDGLLRTDENLYGTSDNDPDTDDDGLTDYEELMVYHTPPTNGYYLSQTRGWGDLYVDSLLVSVTDTDDDGIPDAIEGFYGLNYEFPLDATRDLDGNGISNLVQYQAGIALNAGTVSFDSDGDGMTNAFEDYYGLNRDEPGDAVGDLDGDTVMNFEEARLGLSPVLWDTRNAGNLGDLGRLMMALQYPNGGAPTDDTNSNGVADWKEDAQENSTYPYYHRVQNLDFDADGMPDSWEHFYGSWKYTAGGLNLRINDSGSDPDGDGLTNLREFNLSLNPLVSDTDGNGVPDGVQYGSGGGNNNPDPNPNPNPDPGPGPNPNPNPGPNPNPNPNPDPDEDNNDGEEDQNEQPPPDTDATRLTPFEIQYIDWKWGEIGSSAGSWTEATEGRWMSGSMPGPSRGYVQQYRYNSFSTNSPPYEEAVGEPAVYELSVGEDTLAWELAHSITKPLYTYTRYDAQAQFELDGAFLSAEKIIEERDSSEQVLGSIVQTMTEQEYLDFTSSRPPDEYHVPADYWAFAWTVPGDPMYYEYYELGTPESVIEPSHSYTTKSGVERSEGASLDFTSKLVNLPSGDWVRETVPLYWNGGIVADAIGWYETEDIEYKGAGGADLVMTGRSGHYNHGKVRIGWSSDWEGVLDDVAKEAWMSRYVVVLKEVTHLQEDGQQHQETIVWTKPLLDVVMGEGVELKTADPTTYQGYVKTVSLRVMRVEFVSRKSKASEITVAVPGVGLTNQRPTVKLDSLSSSDVSISNGVATVQIKGTVRDVFADNVPEGKGADIENVRIVVNGEELKTAAVGRQQDGAATTWRQFPCKGVIEPSNVSFAAQGVVTVRVETAQNAAGEVGYDDVQFRFDKQANGGVLVGGGSISYDFQFTGTPQLTSIDTMQAKASAISVYTALTETAADSNIFASPDGQFIVRFFSAPTLTNQIDEISCVVLDAASSHAASGSGGGGAFCVETGSTTNTFRYSQTIQPIRAGVTYNHTLAEVINAETPDVGGNHPFTWRMPAFGDASQTNSKLGGATFNMHDYEGSLMPKGSETRHVIAYLVRHAEQESAPLKLLYYDEMSQSLVTRSINDAAELLKLKLVINEQEIEIIKLAHGHMEWRTPSGEPVEELAKIPAQTLVDYINGDDDVEIDEKSAQVLRVIALDEDSPRVRVRSSEIPQDFFELSKSSDPGTKQATLKEVGAGIFESQQKIIVYESSPNIQTLSENQWQALKGKGFLAVHNLTAEAVQIINDISLDSKAGEIMQQHHIFNQWDGPDVDPRYKNFWSKIFDPGTFDVHDYTVEVSATRHARFSNHCTQAWKRIIESVTDASGNLLPTVDRAIVRRTMIETAFEMIELYHLPIESVRRYPKPGGVKEPLGSKLDNLIRLDEGTDPIRWGDPTDHRTKRWAKYGRKAVKKYGKAILRSMPYLGHAMTAWALINFASNPSAALASELNISKEAALLLIEGKVCAKLQFWQPNSPVQSAQLVRGSVHIGMTYFYTHQQYEFGRGWYVARVEEGNVVRIETTDKPGFVNLRVRVGQEERVHTNQCQIQSGIPEEGKLAPPGW